MYVYIHYNMKKMNKRDYKRMKTCMQVLNTNYL